VTTGPGGKTFHYADVRYVAAGTLNALPLDERRLPPGHAVGTQFPRAVRDAASAR
jgi:hypothetical protein